RALASKHTTPSVYKGATQRPGVEANGDLVWKTSEDAALDRAGLWFDSLQIQTFVPGDREKLVGKLRRFAGGAGVDSKLAAAPGIETTLLGVAEGAHQNEEIGIGVAAENI